MAFPVPLSRGG
ncbi:hypothetical protein VCHC59B1_3384A, partial [Vibrio cholerae HC-59B1]